jgi:hypothetical protein
MAGLDPAIHVVMQENSSKSMCWRNAVDARLKAGHDNILAFRRLKWNSPKNPRPLAGEGGAQPIRAGRVRG